MASAAEAGRHYQLYAVIDPENVMQEVHEKRDLAVDSGGNNEGYFEFSVEGNNASVTAGSLDGVRASLTQEERDNLEYPTLLINGEDSYPSFYDKYIKDSEGPVEIELTITNNEDITLPDIYLQASYQDPDAQLFKTFYCKKIVLFPNETYTTRFVLDGEDAEKVRELASRWSWIHYDIAGDFFSTEYLEALLSGDPDPELEVLSIDETVSEDKSLYCTTTITKTFTLSSDTPVFWRINGVAQVINSSEANSDDVYISPVAPTEEHFAVTKNPEDFETVKTSEAELTISTIPGVTPAGNYSFRIETSDDGENWEQKDFLTIEAVSSSNVNTPGSSSGGCDAGFSVMALAGVLAAVLLKRR